MTARPILLIEDNPDDEALTIRALRRNKISNEIIVARDGVEALDYLFGTGPRACAGRLTPQLILLDLNLPRIDGLEVLRRVRADADGRKLPIVVLTSSREERDLLCGYELGCNSYVRKPIAFDAFVEAARRLCEYWLNLNECPRGNDARMPS
ncbi:response regulator [Jiella mangrovi]|uniref:Response regulator n=1 Tax=Jiella mangrovi TaxID=2821407 RepID=A0ABS4BKW2_9HYPH|nr:response regulator [Jiella mangrovi]MBP0616804.1 response regulator [Jiella mangrovi]